MSVLNGIITAPVSIKDVQEVLEETSNDLATLCKSSNINMWAKYKPVYYGKKFVQDKLNSDGGSWTAKSGCLGWWLGNSGVENASLVIPLVTSKEDFDNGKGKWSYNKPTGGENSPYRLSDFVGYYHDATLPIYPSYPSTSSFFLSETATFSVTTYNMDDIEYPDHCVTLQDVFQILTQTASGEVYPAIYIYNVTKKRASFYSKSDPIDVSLDDETYQFLIKFSSGSPISEGGCGFSCDVGDVIRVFLLLCTTGGVEDNYFFNSYSLQVLPGLDGYKEFTLKSDKDKTYTYDSCVVTVTEKNVTQSSDYAGMYCLDGDGNVLKIAGFLTIDGKFKYTYTSSHYPSKMTYTILGQYNDGMDTFMLASETVSKTLSATSTSSSFSFSNLGFTVYSSVENAENQDGGFRVEGMPLIEKNVSTNTTIETTRIDLHVYFDPYEGDSLITAYNITYNENSLYSSGSVSAKKWLINFDDSESDEASTTSEGETTSTDTAD